jgi:hypothetical protein
MKSIRFAHMQAAYRLGTVSLLYAKSEATLPGDRPRRRSSGWAGRFDSHTHIFGDDLTRQSVGRAELQPVPIINCLDYEGRYDVLHVSVLSVDPKHRNPCKLEHNDRFPLADVVSILIGAVATHESVETKG